MVVLDTTIVFKWFDDTEGGHEAAIELLEWHNAGNETIIIPDLLLYEITNAWATKAHLEIAVVHDNISLLETYLPTPLTVTFGLLQSASTFAKQYAVSAYDAVYAVLAKEHGCALITADKKFVQRVNLPFVKLLSTEIASK